LTRAHIDAIVAQQEYSLGARGGKTETHLLGRFAEATVGAELRDDLCVERCAGASRGVEEHEARVAHFERAIVGLHTHRSRHFATNTTQRRRRHRSKNVF
jgi:hypothetical protein